MKVLGVALVVVGTLIGLPAVIACFTIVLIPIGLPFALAGAGIAGLGLLLARGKHREPTA